MREGVERFGRYFGGKGWFGFTKEGRPPASQEGDTNTETEGIEERWHVGERSSRILVEVATAYAITKVFLPARILLSVWGTPWFARAVLGPVTRIFGRSKNIGTGAAGLGGNAGGIGGGLGKGKILEEGVKKMPP